MDGWGSFKWGFGRFSSWGFGRGMGTTTTSTTTGGGGGDALNENFPSKTDFARNFGEEAEEPDPYDDGDGYEYEYDEEASPSPADDGDGYSDGEEPLYPGLYRALYAFEPEGTAEMKLDEDQVVRVIGRGGGVGWAVVDRGGGEGGGHALVPESYLEVVRLDEEGEGVGA